MSRKTMLALAVMKVSLLADARRHSPTALSGQEPQAPADGPGGALREAKKLRSRFAPPPDVSAYSVQLRCSRILSCIAIASENVGTGLLTTL
jgi:hypothetical protein